jgi:hypothetical protein
MSKVDLDLTVVTGRNGRFEVEKGNTSVVLWGGICRKASPSHGELVVDHEFTCLPRFDVIIREELAFGHGVERGCERF